MKKDFFKVADDICIAATAEKAAELIWKELCLSGV